jgi:protein-disulfide isomerase
MSGLVVSIELLILAGGVGQQPASPAAIGPVFGLEKTEYDLGVIDPKETEIVGSVVITNPGDQPLEIKRAVSPCSCFSEYFGDTTIAPASEGVLFISFYKNKIAKGPARQMAQIQTNDPKKPSAAVYFTFTVTRDAQQEEQYQLYKELDAVRQELRALRQEMRNVLAELKELKSRTGSPDNPAPPAARQGPDTAVYDIAIGDSPVLGKKDAPVTIVEFSDFQCPYCVREYPKLQQILKDYPNQVRLVFKHFPLAFHTKARPVHAAAETAKRRLGPEAFWKIHDWVMDNPKNLEPEDLKGYARRVGLEPESLDTIWNDPNSMNDLLASDLEEAKKCKVTGTPTILINGLKLADRTPEGYRKRIDEILKK